MCCFQVNTCLFNNAMHCEELMASILEAEQPPLQVIGAPGQIICPPAGFEASWFETGLRFSLWGALRLACHK